MASQGLPFDVLLLVMEASPLPTAARMSQTCHTLRESGARFLLDRGVSLASGDSIISFVQFMCVDPDNRFEHLRSLELACGKIPPPAVDALLTLISHSSLAIDSLTLQDADAMLKSTLVTTPSPPGAIHGGQPDQLPLIDAFTGLTTIRHLAIRGHCGLHAWRVVKSILSPLKTVSIDFAPLGRGLRVDDLLRRNPILTLASHAATLEEISGKHFAMLPEEDPLGMVPEEHLVHTVYPAVRTITATLSFILPPRTLQLIAAFPNLTRLSLTPPVHSSDSGVSSRIERAMARRHWQRQQQENCIPRQTWAHLEELEGSLTDILALGLLGCHVPMVRLTGALSEPAEYEHVKIVLGDTRPTGLAITVARVSLFGDMMRPVLSDPSAQQLREMEVELVLPPSDRDLNIEPVLNDVAATLALLPLRRVALKLNYDMFGARENSCQYANSSHVDRDAKRRVDAAATLALFREAIPSLVTDVVVKSSRDRAT
ncbi:hypothetical protein GSI_04988 [Ganoderma sinense ZZ0214-1]|uniref:F-box domain-containing protein n=1 Tax=Ganoderma sinense ZZ0214-1 TaxID=1077348 RepID=A0A2G8SGG6_9APHY|nr:hypothetical protein GSI_04988 [Ganoderma sinense ZZ0214-1]